MKSVQDWLKGLGGEGEQKPATPAANSPPKFSQTPIRQYRPVRPANNSPRQPQPQQHRNNNPGGRSGLKIYPLGGFEEVGRNCLVVDVDGDLYVIDIGLQFPEDDMLGIDYLIPDLSSLRGRENRIKAILFTHGHLDHIGAVQHVIDQLKFPPCYGTKLTMGFVRKRLDEEKLTSRTKLNIAEYLKPIQIGKVKVEFLRVTHSIPDSAAIALHTPYGTVLHTGDFKFDLTPMNEPPADFQRLAELGDEGVLAIIADSTNAMKPGNSLSEKAISETLYNLMRDANGRLVISTFSSLLNRLQQVLNHARVLNRKVFVVGRSMEQNIEIAQQLGYVSVPRGLIRKASPAMDKLPDREVLILTTGSQGEERAGLARMGLGIHQHVSIRKGDTVILSSNPIIGNERAVAKVINNLHLLGARVFTNQELALHTTGHGYQNDILLMHRLVRAKHVIPEHGEPYMRAAHAELARMIGYEENRLHLLTNGEILEFDSQGNARRSKQKLSANDIIIDGRGKGGEGQRIMDERRGMSNGGAAVIVLRVYSESMRLMGDPIIITRGLLYGGEQQEVIQEAIKVAKKAYEEAHARGEKTMKNLKREVTSALYRFLRRKIEREPLIMPVIVEI